jgi:hypothetical protein
VSRSLAVTVAAVFCGTAHSRGKDEWQALIPQPVLMVLVISADVDALWCHLKGQPDSGVFTLEFAPWPVHAVLKYPLREFPVQGRLIARDVRVTTRMGRTVRYLIPVFTTA